MCPSLAPERLNGSYSNWTFKNLSIIGQCLVNMNILAAKLDGLQMDLKNEIGISSKMRLTILIKCQQFMEITSVNKTV
jgi:hypothetical protein